MKTYVHVQICYSAVLQSVNVQNLRPFHYRIEGYKCLYGYLHLLITQEYTTLIQTYTHNSWLDAGIMLAVLLNSSYMSFTEKIPLYRGYNSAFSYTR